MSNQAGFTPLVEGPRRWDVLAGFMNEMGFKTFVEVGCKEGRTTGHILKNAPDARAIAIDPWIAQPKGSDPKRETYASWDFEEIERAFWENVGEDKERCTMYRATSKDAATDVPDGGVDLVFIDALHDYESVKEDIALWWPKVRAGGMLAGHDFNHQWPGVERAVAEGFDLMQVGIAPDSVWFVIKRSEEQYRGP